MIIDSLIWNEWIFGNFMKYICKQVATSCKILSPVAFKWNLVIVQEGTITVVKIRI